jgi:hypothetical protein
MTGSVTLGRGYPEVNDLRAAQCATTVEFWRDETSFREYLGECGPKENLAEA